MLKRQPDVIVIGSGAGGGTVTRQLAERGLEVLLLERGNVLPREADNQSVEEVFNRKKYSPQETWLDRTGKPFRPSTWYNVGGSTKFFGTVMTRLRERDFEVLEHAEGVSPAWPFRYADIEPFYAKAEAMFGVHGDASDDPTEPPRSSPYPHQPIGSEPVIAKVIDSLKRKGLHPFPLPVAVDLHPGGKCIRCATCDGFPCSVGGKNDAETRAVEPALATGRVTLWTGAYVRRLILSPNGRSVTNVEVEHEGEVKRLSAKIIVLSSGAVNSTILLLRSAEGRAPRGLCNSSGLVGQNYMTHNLTTMMAVSPSINPTRFQKTLAFNDFYFGEKGFPYPMGNVQTLGKLQAGMLVAGAKHVPRFVAKEMTRRSLDILVTSEDLPRRSNRVTIGSGQVQISIMPNNMTGHRRLNKRVKSILREIGFPLILAKTLPVNFTAAQCGTIRMGSSPEEAPLDAYCRSFDHSNLFVVDASFFPSSGAVNPALTIAAQALRVADHIADVEFGLTSRAGEF
jgi:choline dehydrogenase-like flavoprotein